MNEHINKYRLKMEKNISNQTLEELARVHIKDMRSRRRWKFLMRSTIILILACTIIPSWLTSSRDLKEHIALIRIDGIIADDSAANASRINESLDNAYDNENTKAVLVKINSPGGSPVQSDDIYQHMQYLQKKHPSIPIYAICTDVCASGGYYIAAGAKEIYANKMTITGSIGVLGSGFGFTELMEKLGIERRTYTSGKNKAFLDPFSPKNDAQTKDFEKLLSETHKVFIEAVEKSRGKRLKNKSLETTFSGQPFSGIEAKQIGLIDGYASVDKLKRDKFNDLDVIDYTEPQDFFTQISQKLGSSIYYKVLSETSFSMK